MTATPILEAPPERAPAAVDQLLEWLDDAERRLSAAAGALTFADIAIRGAENVLAIFPSATPQLHERGHDARVARALVRVKQKRAELLREHVDDPESYVRGVKEISRAIGRREKTTRNLLEAGQIPGAEQVTPGKKNSPWLAPRWGVEVFNRKET